MAEKMYFYLLIFCGLLGEGILQVLSGNIVRRKRVINSEPRGDIPLTSGVAPYVVNVRSFPENINICVGSILSKQTVITDAACVIHYNVANIKVQAGSAYSYRGTSHNVVAKKIHYGDHPLNTLNNHIKDGIALLVVQPPFIFNQNTTTIALHTEALFAETPATIFGWGCNYESPLGTNYRNRLRSITLPIMKHQDCVNFYRNRAVISDKHICTYDPNKRCGNTDTGAPLVVNNHLAGIYIWTATTPGHINPDVFLIVQDLEFSQWIRNNIVHNNIVQT